MEFNKLLHTIFLKSPPNLFDEFIIECQKFYELPAHSITEMKPLSPEELRLKRLAYYDKIKDNDIDI
jgi:hypothetical protein